jgi:hypothetical protein
VGTAEAAGAETDEGEEVATLEAAGAETEDGEVVATAGGGALMLLDVLATAGATRVLAFEAGEREAVASVGAGAATALETDEGEVGATVEVEAEYSAVS